MQQLYVCDECLTFPFVTRESCYETMITGVRIFGRNGYMTGRSILVRFKSDLHSITHPFKAGVSREEILAEA